MRPNGQSGEDPLAGGDAAGPDQLRQIVDRARKRWWRAAAGGVAAALALAAGVGLIVSNNTSSGQKVLAGGSTSPTTSAGPEVSPAVGGGTGADAVPSPNTGSGGAALRPVTMKRVFVRTSGHVTIRGFVTEVTVAPAVFPNCSPGTPSTQFTAEVSTADMVATESTGSFATASSTASIKQAEALEVGVLEGDPVDLVLVQTAPAVTKVSVQFAKGITDSMTPVNGWSALAAPTVSSGSASVATVIATEASGTVLQRLAVSTGSAYSGGGGVAVPAQGAASSSSSSGGSASSGAPCCPVPVPSSGSTSSAGSGSAASSEPAYCTCPTSGSGAKLACPLTPPPTTLPGGVHATAPVAPAHLAPATTVVPTPTTSTGPAPTTPSDGTAGGSAGG